MCISTRVYCVDLVFKAICWYSGVCYNERCHNERMLQCDFSGRGIGPTQRLLPNIIQHSQQTDIHAPSKIRIHIPSMRAAADPRVRKGGNRVPQNIYIQWGMLQRTMLRRTVFINKIRMLQRNIDATTNAEE
jgi:hypothetical protein